MRALVIADTAPDFEGDATLDVAAAQLDVDLVITLGDLYALHLKGARSLAVPALGVYGNHCRRGYLDDLGIADLHLRCVSLQGTTFTGLEGGVRYKPGTNDVLYTQAEYARLVASLPPANVLVLHSPPRGLNDDPGDPAHVGIDALVPWIQANKPSVILHGHTYPEPPQTEYLGARVEYVHGWRVIELP